MSESSFQYSQKILWILVLREASEAFDLLRYLEASYVLERCLLNFRKRLLKPLRKASQGSERSFLSYNEKLHKFLREKLSKILREMLSKLLKETLFKLLREKISMPLREDLSKLVRERSSGFRSSMRVKLLKLFEGEAFKASKKEACRVS